MVSFECLHGSRTQTRLGGSWCLYFFHLLCHEISEIPWLIAVKLPCDRYLGALYNASPKIQGPSPKKIWGQKTHKICGILYNFSLWSLISLERVKISKLERQMIQSDTTCIRCKSSVNYGPLTGEYDMWVWTNENEFYRKTTRRFLGVHASQKFYMH